MRLPRVERVRRPQDGAVALDGLDLAGDRGDDPVADLVEHEEGVVERVVEDLGPDDAGGARLGELDRDGEPLALALQRAADDIVDVEHPAGLLGRDAPLAQGEHGALRDDEQAAQLGEPGDHVVGETVGRLRPGQPCAGDWSTNGITAIEARRGASRSPSSRPPARGGDRRDDAAAPTCGAPPACARAERQASRRGA